MPQPKTHLPVIRTWECLRCDVTWVGERTCWKCNSDLPVVSQYAAVEIQQRTLKLRDELEKGKV